MISNTRDLERLLNYNEKKVQQKRAELIHAENFFSEKETMNFYEKIQRFKKLNQLNSRSKVNMLHVSVNFHPSENPDQNTMVAIAKKYMGKIGFSDQPYLVYQHHDAGHPHFHIVSSLITSQGKRIRTRFLGKNLSVKACRELEKEFGLLPNEKKQKKYFIPRPVDAKKIVYGKSEIISGMQNVLVHVLDEYKYTSLPELNAILRQFNMIADRGGEGSEIFSRGGLLYRVLDPSGNPVGVPIRASDFYNGPTLKYLEKKFELNRDLRKQFLPSIKSRIDWTLLGCPKTLEEFARALAKEDIALVVRQNPGGPVYGLTYLDYRTKTVVNGSDLGKEYSAKAVLEMIHPPELSVPEIFSEKQSQPKEKSFIEPDDFSFQKISSPELLNILLEPELPTQDIPYELRLKKKKKRKK